MKTYEALLLYYDYERHLSTDSFIRALEALENASVNEPECGQVWYSLAGLYADVFALELPGFDIADVEQKVILYAEKGTQLDPASQRARSVLAYVRMLTEELAAARREIDLAYEINPNSLFMLDGIGYVMTLLGDWERGPALIRKVISLNPFYEPMVHYGLWVSSLHYENFEQAYQETLGLRMRTVFWYPLAKAASLGLLERCDEGRQYIENLLELKPDFQDRGRILIKKFVKFEDVENLIIEGLARCGLELA